MNPAQLRLKTTREVLEVGPQSAESKQLAAQYSKNWTHRSHSPLEMVSVLTAFARTNDDDVELSVL